MLSLNIFYDHDASVPRRAFFCGSINAFLRTLTFNRLIVLESSSAFVECVLKTQTKKYYSIFQNNVKVLNVVPEIMLSIT